MSADISSQEDPIKLFEELAWQSGEYLPLKQVLTEIGAAVTNPSSEGAAISEFFIPLLMLPNQKNSFNPLFDAYFKFDASSQTTHKWFTQAPNGFLVQAKRFTWTRETGQIKLSEKIDFPLQHRLSKQQCPSDTATYIPDAFILHEGSSSEGGHYVAFVKQEGTNTWWKLNDSKVSKIGLSEVKQEMQNAYLVHYTKAVV